MRLSFLFKDSNSIPGNCPALFSSDITDRHGDKLFVVNGYELSPTEQVSVPDQAESEVAVAIPEKLLRQWAESSGWVAPDN